MTVPGPDPGEADFARLLLDARAGSREALGKVLQACRRYLLRVADRQIDRDLKVKGSPSDLVQETFLDAQRDFPRFHGGSEKEFLAWLSRILRNNVRNLSRDYRESGKRRVEREVRLDDSARSGDIRPNLVARTPTPSSIAIKQEEARAFSRSVRQLPDHYREVIRLRNREHRTFEEIGTIMNTTAECARKLWHRAMRQLADGLKS